MSAAGRAGPPEAYRTERVCTCVVLSLILAAPLLLAEQPACAASDRVRIERTETTCIEFDRESGEIRLSSTANESAARGRVRWRLSSSLQRPMREVTVRLRQLTDDGPRWQWLHDGENAPALDVLVAPGEYELELETPHHRPARRMVTVTGDPVQLGKVVLEAIPRISARVEESGRGVAGAAVETLDGVPLGSSDAAGFVTAAVAGAWPEVVRVVAAGFAPVEVALPEDAADVDLGNVVLRRGGSAQVMVEGIETAGVRVVVLRPPNPRPVLRRTLSASAEPLLLGPLEAGRYLMLLEGDEPLQRFSRLLTIDEGVTSDVSLVIAPRRIPIRATMGRKPIAFAKLDLVSVEHRWETKLTLGEDGSREVEVWQGGDCFTGVEAPALKAPHLLLAKFDEEQVALVLPERSIRGRVVAADSGAPVSGAEVRLRTQQASSLGTTMLATTDATGGFEYTAVAEGRQSLKVLAEGYLTSAETEFELGEGDVGRDLTVRLQRGARRVSVTGANGLPIHGAAVIETAGGRFIGMHETDEAGEVVLPVPPGEMRTIFVVPRQGSFAVAQLPAVRGTDSATALRVAVPPPAANLDLITRSSGGEPVPNVIFFVRYDGELLPFEVNQVLERMQGATFATNAAGRGRVRNLPMGFVELWPARSAAEAAAKPPGGTAPAVQLEIRAGENVATLTFERASGGGQSRK